MIVKNGASAKDVQTEEPKEVSQESPWAIWNYPANSKKSRRDIDCCEPINLPEMCYSYRVGNMYVFCDCFNSEPATIDVEDYQFPCMTSHQSKFSCITVCLILGIPVLSYSMFFRFWYEVGDVLSTIVFFVGLLLWICTCGSFLLTKFCNPGIRPIPDRIKNDFTIDDLTRLKGPNRVPERLKSESGTSLQFVASHGVYVEGFDHICPWIGNIIAKDNMCYFQCFLTSCTTALIFFVILLLVSLGHADS